MCPINLINFNYVSILFEYLSIHCIPFVEYLGHSLLRHHTQSLMHRPNN
jgi:hypothetical protein